MIKLVSQFDSEEMRASIATPTCGPCCCCCCCCIVTAITSSAITARHFRKKPDIVRLGANTLSESEQKSLKNSDMSIGDRFKNIYVHVFFLALLVVSTLASWQYFDAISHDELIIPLIIGMFLYSIWCTKELFKSWRKAKSAGELILIPVISLVTAIIEFGVWGWIMSELFI